MSLRPRESSTAATRQQPRLARVLAAGAARTGVIVPKAKPPLPSLDEVQNTVEELVFSEFGSSKGVVFNAKLEYDLKALSDEKSNTSFILMPLPMSETPLPGIGPVSATLQIEKESKNVFLMRVDVSVHASDRFAAAASNGPQLVDLANSIARLAYVKPFVDMSNSGQSYEPISEEQRDEILSDPLLKMMARRVFLDNGLADASYSLRPEQTFKKYLSESFSNEEQFEEKMTFWLLRAASELFYVEALMAPYYAPGGPGYLQSMEDAGMVDGDEEDGRGKKRLRYAAMAKMAAQIRGQ